MSKLVKEFFTGGNSTFTVKVPTEFAAKNGCNPHYTYRIRVTEENPKFPVQQYMVSLLSGPNNDSDYKYLGILDIKTGELRLTIRSCAGGTSWAVRILRRVFAQMFQGEGMAKITAAGWDVDHMGKCGRCGRPLTVPESLELGIGPDCADIMGIPYPVRKMPEYESAPVIDPDIYEESPGNIVGNYPALPEDTFSWLEVA